MEFVTGFGRSFALLKNVLEHHWRDLSRGFSPPPLAALCTFT
jgi:hypothetical protein